MNKSWKTRVSARVPPCICKRSIANWSKSDEISSLFYQFAMLLLQIQGGTLAETRVFHDLFMDSMHVLCILHMLHMYYMQYLHYIAYILYMRYCLYDDYMQYLPTLKWNGFLGFLCIHDTYIYIYILIYSYTSISHLFGVSCWDNVFFCISNTHLARQT